MGENLILTFIYVAIFVLTGYIPSHSASRVQYDLLGNKKDRRIGIEPLVEPFSFTPSQLLQVTTPVTVCRSSIFFQDFCTVVFPLD